MKRKKPEAQQKSVTDPLHTENDVTKLAGLQNQKEVISYSDGESSDDDLPEITFDLEKKDDIKQKECEKEGNTLI